MRTLKEIEAAIRKEHPWTDKVLAYDGERITLEWTTTSGELYRSTYPVVHRDCA
jgi:hypothetical protein